MDITAVFRTYIPRYELNDEMVREDFDENLVCITQTLSSPALCLERYFTDDDWYRDTTLLEVTRDGHVLSHPDRGDFLEEDFQKLISLPPDKRWDYVLELARSMAEGDLQDLTHTRDPIRTREKAIEAVEQFLANRRPDRCAYAVLQAGNIRFALDDENCELYPFSKSVELFEHWPYLEDTGLNEEDIEEGIETIAFVFLHS